MKSWTSTIKSQNKGGVGEKSKTIQRTKLQGIALRQMESTTSLFLSFGDEWDFSS